MGAVTHQSAGFRVLAHVIECRFPMSPRLYCELETPAEKEWISSNKKCVRAIAGKCFKGSFDFATVTRLNDLDLKPASRRCCRYVLRYALCFRRRVWIDKHANTCGGRNKFMQQSKLFCPQFPDEEIHAGRITARSAKACDQTETHRVFGNIEDNWDRGSCVLGSQCSDPDRNDNS